MLVAMPFQSQQQARFAFGTSQPWAKHWADETDFSKLPKRVRRVRSRRLKGCTCGQSTKEQLSPGVTRIRGNLCNVHGKYGPCDAATGGKKPKGGKGKAPKVAKPKQTPEQRAQARTAEQDANTDKTLTALGMGDEAASTLLSLASGEGGGGDDFGLIKQGLLERDTAGNLRLSGSGRAFLSAAKRGDAGAARDAMSRGGDTVVRGQERATARTQRQEAAAQRKTEVVQRRAAAQQKRAAAAKKPKGGGAAKPATAAAVTPEAPDTKRQANRERVMRDLQLDGDIGAGLTKLAAGAQPDHDVGGLVDSGLAEQDTSGAYRMSTAGRMFMNAAGRGDAGAARDAMSRARDRVAQQSERQQQQATRQQDQAQRQTVADRRRAVAAARAESAANQTNRSANRRTKAETYGGVKRSNLDDSVFAGPDRSFPIKTAQDVLDAVRSLGRTKHDKAAVRRGIIRRARAIGATTALPDSWRASAKEQGTRLPHQKNDQHRTKQYQQINQTEEEETAKEKIHNSSIAQFTVYKDASGADRWISVSSTAYRDRDQEIVSTNALSGAVALADASGYRGPLRFWHVPGVEIGDCDFQATAQDGRFLIESGTFRSPALAAAVKERADGYQVSIGFTHPASEPDPTGVFSHIAIFERSLVPKGRASNPFTQVSLATKEIRMLTTEKATELARLLGGDKTLLDGLLAQVATTDKSAQDGGIAYKDDQPPAWAASLITRIEAIETSLKSTAEIVTELDVTKDDGEGDMETMAAEAGMDEASLEPDGDENMLNDGEIAAIANAVVAAIVPHLDIEKRMAGHLNEMKGLIGGMGATKDAALAEVKEQLKTVTEQVADLNGSQPRILSGGYRASQSASTVTTDEKLKDAAPQSDPKAASFAAFLQDMGLGGQPHA